MQFGPDEGDNFIKNKKTGDMVKLRRKGGSYVLEVEFVMDAGDEIETAF